MTMLLLSTADTELLAARSSGAPWQVANPSRIEPAQAADLATDASVIVLRLLGGTQAWPGGIEALRSTGRPVVVLGGETAPDAQLMAASTVPAGVAAEALAYLSQGGPANLHELYRFLSDTLLLTGEGFEQPAAMAAFGVRPGRARAGGRPLVGVVYYRAHELSGNTGFVDTLCDALEAAGADALPVFCGSLRGAETGLYELLAGVDALVVTVLAAGGATAAAGDESWDVGALAALDVPVLQGLCLTTPRAAWAESDAGLSPLDAAMQVAVPEFDGRLITVPFSFKEDGPDGVPVYVADAERSQRIAGLATAYARLRSTPNAGKRLALVLSSYPTKHSRVGNAVGLDTPASAIALLQALDAAGYDLGPEVPTDGDALIHALIAAGGHDVEWLTEEQLRSAPARVPLATYQRWFSQLPQDLRESVIEAWGPPPAPSTSTVPRSCWRACASATSCSPSSRRAASARIRSPSTTTRPSHRATITSPRTGGLLMSSAPTPSCIWASTGRWNGCPVRDWACRRRAHRTPCSVICR